MNDTQGMDCPTITPSNAKYLDCLKKYHTLSVLKQYPGTRAQSPALVYGEAVHDVLRGVYKPNPTRPAPHMRQLQQLIQAAFLRQPYRQDADREWDMRRCERLVRRYVEQDEDATYTLAVEQQAARMICVDDLRYRLSARLDRLIVRPHQPEIMVVRDYKVGSSRSLEEYQCLINLAVAKILMPGYQAYTLEIDVLCDEEGVQRTVYHSRQYKGMIQLLHDRVRRYTDAMAYPAEPGSACVYCPLLATCQPETEIDGNTLDFTG